jgi:hypothetical protein
MVTMESTTREMLGLAMANEIGRRNNPDVSIKRMNKLTYKVKSQSNHDNWYTVINTYDTGWVCDCPDFTFRHLECKHVHCVKFSKKVYLDTFANKPIIPESKVVIELGISVNKLRVLRKDDCIEIKPAEWLDKENWREINEILVRHGWVTRKR